MGTEMLCKKCGGERRPDRCNLCEMFAARRAPRGRSDCTLMAAIGAGGERQFANMPHYGKRVMAKAKKTGQGKGVYMSGPGVWVESYDDIKRVCDQTGYSCQGLLDYTPPARDVAPPKPVALANDIVADEMKSRLIRDGVEDIRDVNLRDLEEKVRQDHAPPKTSGLSERQLEAKFDREMAEIVNSIPK